MPLVHWQVSTAHCLPMDRQVLESHIPWWDMETISKYSGSVLFQTLHDAPTNSSFICTTNVPVTLIYGVKNNFSPIAHLKTQTKVFVSKLNFFV